MKTESQNRRARTSKIILILMLAITLVLPSAQAAPGDLDTSFNPPNGFATLTNNTLLRDVVIQPDGKILAAGSSNDGTSEMPLVARFNTDGSLDSSFGTGGVAQPPFETGSSTGLVSIVLQPDGKIVLGATSFAAGFAGDLYVARLNADGSADTDFGTGGFVEIDFGTQNDILRGGVAIGPGGTIAVAGSSSFTYTLARLTSGGALDPTFGTGGKVTVPSGDSVDVAVLADGRILVAGGTFEVLRFTSGGALDSMFGGGDGRVSAGFPGISEAHAMTVQPDGRIILAGSVFSAMMLVEALARFDSEGTLDTSFGVGGRVTADPLPPGHRALDVTLQSDGRIVTCGVIGENLSTGFLSRYNSDGSPDSSFGIGGRVVADLPVDESTFEGLALQTDGKIVIAGLTSRQVEPPEVEVKGLVARYLGDGGPPPPPPPPFDICIQKGPLILRFNSTTGAYEFRDCGTGLVLTGTGTIFSSSCKLTLADLGPGSYEGSVLAKINTCTKGATASVSTALPPRSYVFNDTDITQGSCVCPAP